jgi:Flp pilus assembly protein TadD
LHHQGTVLTVAFSPDGRTVVTGSQGTARLWSATTGKPLGSPLRHLDKPGRFAGAGPQGDLIKAVAFSPDGKVVVTADEETTRRWSATTGKPLGEPWRHPQAVGGVAFSPDGRTLLTVSADHTARLWSAATGRPLGAPMQHPGPVEGVAFSPDGRTLLTGSRDNTARLWSSATGRPLGAPLRHQGLVRFVAFSPDGKAVLTGSYDGTARLWRVGEACEGDPNQVKFWTRVTTGTEFDPHGAVHVLDGPTWSRSCQELLNRPKRPLPRETNALAWHRQQTLVARADKNWFAAVWHLNRLVKAAPADAYLRQERATAYLELDNFQQAAEDLARACELPGADSWVWVDHARLRLYLGDDQGYRRACGQLLQKWGQTQDPYQANSIAWTCCLDPRGVADFKPVLGLAKRAVAKYPNHPDLLNTFGATLYRAGQFADALKRMQQAHAKSWGRWDSVENWLFLAMAHHRLGHSDDAKTCLATAVQQIEGAKDISTQRRLDLLILRREAERLLKQPMKKDAPNKPEREK